MVNFEELSVNSDIFSKLQDRLRYNKTISGFYENLSSDNSGDSFLSGKFARISERVEACSTIWDVLHFSKQNVKFLDGFTRCKDKFCVNCQSALALKRFHQFAPIFDDFSKTDNVYHCVFTVKNCSGGSLKTVIKQMFKSFSYLVRYLDGRSKIAGLDFKFMGFRAGVRALEVTYNKDDHTYHPHLHCLMVFSKVLDLDKKIENTFSVSRKHHNERYFSLVEVLFQRIWFLLNTGKKVTLDNIDSVVLGFSVTIDRAEENSYKEVFKYALKNDLAQDKCLQYEQFKVYQEHLKGLRFIQGYGDCLNYDFEDESVTAEDLETFSDELVAELYDVEEPDLLHEDVHQIIEQLKSNGTFFLTRGSIKKFFMSDDSIDVVHSFEESIRKK